MNINMKGIGIGSYQDGMQENRKANGGQEFQTAFTENFSLQTGKKLDKKTIGAAGLNIVARNRVAELNTSHGSGVKECEPRNLSLEESDYVKPDVAEGCLYKALVDTERGVVYVERKAEDGTVRGYEIEAVKLGQETEDTLKLLAAIAWQKAIDAKDEAEAKAQAEDAIRQLKNKAIENVGSEGASSQITDFQRALLSFAEFVEDRIKNGEPKIPIGGQEFSETDWKRLIDTFDKAINEIKKEIKAEAEQAAQKAISAKEAEKARQEKLFSKLGTENKAPYAWLADDSGCITYNGVTFVCDNDTRSINLGDVSDRSKILSIPLAGGGTLNVNRDNIDDLARAIGMFSPEDVKRIMNAIATDAQCQKKLLEIEDTKDNPKNLFRIS